MDLGLKGKRVLVTGGTRSIGRAIVEAFMAEGAVVGFCARDAKLVKQREDEWRGKQARVHGTALDVTDNAALKKWIDGFAADGAEYLVASSQLYGVYLDDAAGAPQKFPQEYAAYLMIFSQTDELARFTPSPRHPGPELRILKIRRPAIAP